MILKQFRKSSVSLEAKWKEKEEKEGGGMSREENKTRRETKRYRERELKDE